MSDNVKHTTARTNVVGHSLQQYARCVPRVRRNSPPEPTPATEPTPPPDPAGRDAPIDVNAVVSFNLRAIRERRGWTQQQVADKLARLTGHRLPQASISAMERGFDGERRRRFDAHELYLLSEVFEVPIPYFFLPPSGALDTPIADTGIPAIQLYFSIIGSESQLGPIDERMQELRLTEPSAMDPLIAAVFGDPRGSSATNWHDHFRTWRKRQVDQLAREYGDRLDDLAAVLAEFAGRLQTFGPRGYLQALAHKEGETSFPVPAEPDDEELGEDEP